MDKQPLVNAMQIILGNKKSLRVVGTGLQQALENKQMGKLRSQQRNGQLRLNSKGLTIGEPCISQVRSSLRMFTPHGCQKTDGVTPC